uniref:Uncharacterized protein n=1 Tax=Solanum tuberosum TaxID=4113 RepID=M1DCF8_SOLTU
MVRLQRVLPLLSILMLRHKIMQTITQGSRSLHHKSLQGSYRLFVKVGELGSPNAVVVTKSRQDEAKQGNSTTEKFSNQWTLALHKKTVDSKSSNNHILHQNNSTQVEFDRSNSVVECTQFNVLRDENFGQYEGLHDTAELSVESENTLYLEKQIEQTGKSKQRCHDDHIDQQALVTHEKELLRRR